MATEVAPEYLKKRILILGVGNTLFGDDGFGPATVEYMLKNCKIPDDLCVMDAGISAGELLFTIALSQKRPEKIIVIDAVDANKKPGEIFEILIEDLPENKIGDFSLHLFPSTNLLKEIRDQLGVKVTILACQAGEIPKLVSPGLSKPVQKSIPKAAKIALQLAESADS